MPVSSSCQVFFPRTKGVTLRAAADALEHAGIEVHVEPGPPEHLRVRWGGPVLRVYLDTRPHVAAEAAEIGEATAYEAALRACDARFDIAFDDLDEVLEETNTLIQVQLTLQALTGGFQLNCWNAVLAPPP